MNYYHGQKPKFKNQKTIIGYITKYEVAKEMIKNDLVGENDYYHHIITVKPAEGDESSHVLRQKTEEHMHEEGTYVSFNYYPAKEAKEQGLETMVEWKSFVKRYTQEELKAFSDNSQKEAKKEPEETKNQRRKNGSFRRNGG